MRRTPQLLGFVTVFLYRTTYLAPMVQPLALLKFLGGKIPVVHLPTHKAVYQHPETLTNRTVPGQA
jgi:hypothetical protein